MEIAKLPQPPQTLRLPENSKRRQQLTKKLKVYRLRLEDEPQYAIDSATKIFILHCLLQSEDGQIETADIYAALPSCDLSLWLVLEANPMVWINACCVIDRYCKGELDKVVDGTGLPEVDQE